MNERDSDFDFGDEGGMERVHKPVFNVSNLDHTTCLHMNDPALDMLLDQLDLGRVEDKTARAMFHHLYNAAERQPPRRQQDSRIACWQHDEEPTRHR